MLFRKFSLSMARKKIYFFSGFSSDKLESFRKILSKYKLNGYIMINTDEHQSEYLAPEDQRILKVSGFSGSNALGLISQNEAVLWTDSRYYIQAKHELKEGWQMQKLSFGEPTLADILLKIYEKKEEKIIGFDPKIFSIDFIENLTTKIKDSNIKLEPIMQNLIDKIPIDEKEKPEKKEKNNIFFHEEEFAGSSIDEKIGLVRKKMTEKYFFTSSLAEIAWVLNLRGNDIPFNPFFKSFLLFSKEKEITLFVDIKKLNKETSEYLSQRGIKIIDYKLVGNTLKAIDDNIIINKKSVNYFILDAVKNPVYVSPSYLEYLKAIKNQREIQGFKDCHVRDAIAMIKLFYWLSEIYNKQNEDSFVTEYQISEKSIFLRSQQDLYMGPSFTPIVGSALNSAIIHYSCPPINSKKHLKDDILLIDSGGHYKDGTTDLTRVVCFGENEKTKQFKKAYNTVLLSNLTLERTIWPSAYELTGIGLDAIARTRIWQNQWDFGHGTGHGVGYFLSVHEGPHSISKKGSEVFKEGMIVTNEPGVYWENKFGIRIENVLLVKKHTNQKFLCFENLSMIPYDRNLIDLQLLNQEEIKYIDDYHKQIFEAVGVKLEEEERKWLKNITRPLEE